MDRERSVASFSSQGSQRIGIQLKDQITIQLHNFLYFLCNYELLTSAKVKNMNRVDAKFCP